MVLAQPAFPRPPGRSAPGLPSRPEAGALEGALGRRPEEPGDEAVCGVQVRRALDDGGLVDDVRLRRLADCEGLQLPGRGSRVGDVDEARIGLAERDLRDTLRTSVSSLTTCFRTAAAMPRFPSTVRVYAPTGTDGSPTTIFTPGFVRSSTVWMSAGFDFGTT